MGAAGRSLSKVITAAEHPFRSGKALATVAGLGELDGRYAVESAPSRTTFTIKLPANADAEAVRQRVRAKDVTVR